MMSLSISTKKMPQSMGSSSSLWMMTAQTPMMPPMVSEPVSPIKTCAGKALYQRKPIMAPTKAQRNTTSSSEWGMYMMSK